MAVQGLDNKIDQVKDELKADIKDVKAEIKDVKSSTNKIFYTMISAMLVFIVKTVVMFCIHGR